MTLQTFFPSLERPDNRIAPVDAAGANTTAQVCMGSGFELQPGGDPAVPRKTVLPRYRGLYRSSAQQASLPLY